MGLRTKIREFLSGFGEKTPVATAVKEHDLTQSPPFYDAALLPGSLSPSTYLLPGSVTGYRNVVGMDSNVIMSPVMFIMRTFIEAQAVVESRRPAPEPNQKPVWEHALDHPAELLLDQPNAYYDGDRLWQATLLSYVMHGNAYWRKIRNIIGEVVELWYLPHWLVLPHYPVDGSQYLDYYEYRPFGALPERIAVRDIVHFRFGLDPRNTRLGIQPIESLLREIMTDDEAATFSAAILKNMGVPGLVVSPKSETMRPSASDVTELKTYMNGPTFRGSNRGTAVVLGVPTDVTQFGFDPNKLTLNMLRDSAEERVCAALGLPAAVVGFGSGMEATKVGATMRELVKMAWVGCLSPIQKSLAKQGSRQLLPDFVSQTRRFRIRFDTSDVSGFQEDDNQLAERAARLVQAGILRVDRAQAMVGVEVDDTQEIYLRPSNSVAVDDQGNVIQAAKPNGAVDPNADPNNNNPIPPAVAARLNGGNGTGAGNA